jgi:hypothetical protein
VRGQVAKGGDGWTATPTTFTTAWRMITRPSHCQRCDPPFSLWEGGRGGAGSGRGGQGGDWVVMGQVGARGSDSHTNYMYYSVERNDQALTLPKV